MKKKFLSITLFLLTLVSSFLFASPNTAHTQTRTDLKSQITSQIDTGAKTAELGTARKPQELITDIIIVALSFTATIFLILTVYAGYLYFTAQGDDSKIDKAKTILRAAVVGWAIIVMSYSITLFIGRSAQQVTTGSMDEKKSGLDYKDFFDLFK